MSAYLIADVNVENADSYAEYRRQVLPLIERHGGKFIVRGGAHETLEGDWRPARLVIIEFPSLEQAKRWYDCEEYRDPKAMRLRAGRTNLVMVDGVPPA